MWEFIKRHPFLFGALLFFFLAAIGLGVGLTVTGIFAPFGLAVLGLAGAGALLFAIVFIPVALILAIPLRHAWVREEGIINQAKAEDDLLDQHEKGAAQTTQQQPGLPGSSVTPTPGVQLKDQITSTTSTTSTSSSSSARSSTASSSSASTVVSEEEARRVSNHIIDEIVKKKLPGWALFVPPIHGGDWGLNIVKVEGGYKLVLASPEQARSSTTSNPASFRADAEENNDYYDVSRGTENLAKRDMYCPQSIKDIMNSINSRFGGGENITNLTIEKQNLNNYFYTYEYGFEIFPMQVKQILATLPPELQPASTTAPASTSSTSSTSSVPTSTSSSSSTSTVSTGGGAKQPPASLSSSPSTGGGSAIGGGVTTGSPAGGVVFSSPLSSPSPSSSFSSSSSTPLVATQEEAERVKQHIVKEVTTRKLGGHTRLHEASGGELSIEADKSNYQIVYSPPQLALLGTKTRIFDDIARNLDEGYDASDDPGNTKMMYCPTGLFKLIKTINEQWGKGKDIAEPVWNRKNLEDGYTYEYSLKISSENVKRIFDTLPPLAPESTQTPTQTLGT